MKTPLFLNKLQDQHSDGTYFSLYKCGCGVKFKTLDRSIKSKKTVSCGCYRKTRWIGVVRGTPPNALKDPTESSFNGLYLRYKNSAKIKNLAFTLNKERFKKLTSSECYYCGDMPGQTALQTKHSRQPYIYNGIDRVNNALGYTTKNSVSCCKDCNYLKSAKSKDEFMTKIFKISKRWTGRL